MSYIINQIRNVSEGSELLARLSAHMHSPDAARRIREAQLFAARYAEKHFRGDAIAMINDCTREDLFQKMIIDYGRELLGLS